MRQQHNRRRSVRSWQLRLSVGCFWISSLLQDQNPGGERGGGVGALSLLDFVSKSAPLFPRSGKRHRQLSHQRKDIDSPVSSSLSSSSTPTEGSLQAQVFDVLPPGGNGSRFAAEKNLQVSPPDEDLTARVERPGTTEAMMMLLEPALLVAASMVAAVMIISWEGLAAEHALPSRQTRSRIVSLSLPSSPPASSSPAGTSPRSVSNTGWGQVTVQGMGFGWEERQLLMRQQDDEPLRALPRPGTSSSDTDVSEIAATGSGVGEDSNPLLQLPDRPSYNEIMRKHRKETLAAWRQLDARRSLVPNDDGASSPMKQDEAMRRLHEDQAAARSVLLALESIESLQRLAVGYRWEDLREALRSDLWQADLNAAAARLRTIDDASTRRDGASSRWRQEQESVSSTIGFDWGSCAWRQGGCGAWADWQESVDQIDALLGVLEPHEVLFCLDIVERSLRAVLDVIPLPLWHPRDWTKYQTLRPYQPYFAGLGDDSSAIGHPHAGGLAESEMHNEVDPYLRALMDLRID